MKILILVPALLLCGCDGVLGLFRAFHYDDGKAYNFSRPCYQCKGTGWFQIDGKATTRRCQFCSGDGISKH